MNWEEKTPEPGENPLGPLSGMAGLKFSRDDVLRLIVARFLCKRVSDLTWKISPYAVEWARRQGLEIGNNFNFVPDDSWRALRDLGESEALINGAHDYFQEMMRVLVVELGKEVDRYTGIVRPHEYRILLVYAGQDVYDFFSRDHRFGAPPRGKIFRTNLRRGFDAEREPCSRPDVAVLALRRKIKRYKEMGADVAELEAELERRKEVLARGGDPMEGVRRGPKLRHKRLTPEEVVDMLRGPRK